MSSKQILLYKMAGLCGVLSPVIAFTCIGLAIFHSPWFSWTRSWLSDLGGTVGETPVWAARGIASIIFNAGLIVAGILGILFVVGIIKSGVLGIRLGRLGSLLLISDMCALSAIGVFPETTGNLHVLAATIFFFLVPMSLLFIGVKLRKSSEKKMGLFMILLGILSLASLPLLSFPQPLGSNAIIEMFPSVAVSVFAVIFGIKLFKKAPQIVRDAEG